MAVAEVPAPPKPAPARRKQTLTLHVHACDMTDATRLHDIKVQMLRRFGEAERGVHVMVDCHGGLWFSLEVVDLLKQVRQVVEFGRVKFVLINVDDVASYWLRGEHGFRIVTGSSQLLYGTATDT